MLQAPPLEARRPLRLAAVTCLVAAVTLTIVFLVLGSPLTGGAVASGLLLGTLNGAAAGRLISVPIPFAASSLLRIITLSMVGVGVGLAFGLERVWLVILGLGFAQLALAAAALRAAVRR